jgi:hypothetical protein
VKQLSVDKILSPTSLKVSEYFSDNLSEHFSEYLMFMFMFIIKKEDVTRVILDPWPRSPGFWP